MAAHWCNSRSVDAGWISYKPLGERYPGDFQSLVTQEPFDRVQRRLSGNPTTGVGRRLTQSGRKQLAASKATWERVVLAMTRVWNPTEMRAFTRLARAWSTLNPSGMRRP